MHAIYRTVISDNKVVPDTKRCVGIASDLRAASAFIQTLPTIPAAGLPDYFHYDAVQINTEWCHIEDLLTQVQVNGIVL